jgi:hypothetical protein
LKLKGKSLGNGAQSTGFLFTFDKVAYEPGTLQAIGYDAQGKQIARTDLKTAGPAVALRLTPHTGPGGLRADGADLTLVDVEVVDAAGNRCPTALNPVHFTLTGAAEWRGGISQGSATPVPADIAASDRARGGINPTPLLHEDNYILSKTLPVEDGVNRVILRSLPGAGKIELRAEAEGLKSAEIELSSHAVPEQDGLSTVMPDAGLPSNLTRGPTPPEPSFHQTRFPIAVASITAGSNAADAAKSQDDDDYTSWASDGTLENAWIEYVFTKPETPSQIDVKLVDFRILRYPLRITLDGATAWEGMTPINFGYFTAVLKPTTGTHLRIALTGVPMRGSDRIRDLAGAVPTSDRVERPIKSVLGVSEAEIYRTNP